MKENITLLYVDDEPINLELFEINFGIKYRVITALNGDEGLLKIAQNPDITIVISDMQMPGMNGVEFIGKAKSRNPELTCYILTGYALTEEIGNAIKRGEVSKYFGKPLDLVDLEESIDSCQKV
ncbi:response regulator [Flammeovirgaceae bacterium SG7u.111]|nr:response regulator [Flammeovirgaceae bacterium SG7u.132]WPO34306.1 response regulator [Flammeovirgaceae bacterium SG7u.111]